MKPVAFAAASRASSGVLPGVGLELKLRPLHGHEKSGPPGYWGRDMLRGPEVMGPSK